MRSNDTYFAAFEYMLKLRIDGIASNKLEDKFQEIKEFHNKLTPRIDKTHN